MEIKKISKVASFFFILIGSFNLIIGYIRLYYGVDFIDEAWYVSTIHQFSLGASPFLNEFSIQQFPFILIAPVYKLFSNINFLGLGNVLFVRHIYYLLLCLTSFTTYRLFIRYAPKSVSFALSSIFFVDFSIPSISYNTMGRLLLVMGISLIAIIYTHKGQKIWAELLESALAGLILAVCFFSYITLIVPILITFASAFIFVKIKKDKFRSILVVIGSFIVICIFFFLIFMFNKLNIIIIDLKMIEAMDIHSLNLADKFNRLVSISKLFLIPFTVLIVYKFISKKLKKDSTILFFIAIVAILTFSFVDFKNHAMQYAIFVTLLSFIGFIGFPLFYKKLSANFSLIYFIIITPLCIAGIMTGMTSANGYINICVGISPCAIFSLLILYLIFREISKSTCYFLITILICSLMYTFILFNTIYGEESFTSLTSKVNNGPYKGLYTTSDKAEFLEKIYIDLNDPVIKSEKTILCYYNFPAGYMFTSLKSNFYSTWIMNWWMSKQSFDKMLALNSERKINDGSSPDIIIRYKYNDAAYKGTTAGESSTLGYDPLVNLFKIDDNHYSIFKKTNDYLILINKDK